MPATTNHILRGRRLAGLPVRLFADRSSAPVATADTNAPLFGSTSAPTNSQAVRWVRRRRPAVPAPSATDPDGLALPDVGPGSRLLPGGFRDRANPTRN